jgi:nucleoside-diphosphate-sugar epimerase
MKNTVLITGGAGYIGAKLVQKLTTLDNVKKIIVYDNLMYKQDGLFPFLCDPKIEFVYGDVREEKKLEKLVQEADVIIPLAAIVGFPACAKDPDTANKINNLHVQFIVSKARKDTKIIYPNTNSGYGVGEDGVYCTEKTPLNPISVYGVTKCAAEKSVLDSGGISFRLATVFGVSPRFRKDLLVNNFVLKALTDRYVVLFESHFKRNYIHVNDVVKAFTTMMDQYDLHRGEPFNVGLSTANLSKLELCEKIKQYIPDFVITTNEFSQDLDKRNYIVSNDKLEATGWTPDCDLDYGIQELIKAYPVLINTDTKYTNL